MFLCILTTKQLDRYIASDSKNNIEFRQQQQTTLLGLGKNTTWLGFGKGQFLARFRQDYFLVRFRQEHHLVRSRQEYFLARFRQDHHLVRFRQDQHLVRFRQEHYLVSTFRQLFIQAFSLYNLCVYTLLNCWRTPKRVSVLNEWPIVSWACSCFWELF